MKLGVIGAGNMGGAIIKGYIAAGADANEIYVCGRNREKTEAFAAETGVCVADSIADLTQKSDAILVAVKPKDVENVLAEAAAHLTGEKVVISIAAGISLAALSEMIAKKGGAQSTGAGAQDAGTQDSGVQGSDRQKTGVQGGTQGGAGIIRVMPNTPSMVGEGMAALCRGGGVTDGQFEFAMNLFESIGKAEEVPESLMDAVTGVSGSGPAFVCIFIEALADGAVLEGLGRDKALGFAAQTVLGSAKMVLETGKHPGELKDAVCSPAGTTIEGVRALEESGFRSAAIRAVTAAAEKSKKM